MIYKLITVPDDALQKSSNPIQKTEIYSPINKKLIYEFELYDVYLLTKHNYDITRWINRCRNYQKSIVLV